MRFTRKFSIVVLALLVLTFYDSANATCTLYEGDNALESVKTQLQQLNSTVNTQLESDRDYCQLAHLEYRMSRWHPNQAEPHLKRCLKYAFKATGTKDKTEMGTAFFLRGLCRGRLGEARGFWSSLEIITPFQKDMTLAMKNNPSVDFGGPHRALGKLFYELPFFMGGDIKQSIQHLEKAVEIGPGYWENHYYLAQSYLKKSRYQDAKKELLLARDLAADVHGDPDIQSHRKNIDELMKDVKRILE